MPGLMNDWELAGSKNRWVCPSDRHLALRAKLKTGWSVRTTSACSPVGNDNGSPSPAFAPPSANVANGQLTDAEMEQIKRVLARAEDVDKQEQERVGKLIDKVDRMRKIATGNGVNQCMLCGAEFGLLGPRSYAAMCHDCRKYVCQKNCGVDTVDINRQSIFLCKICSESREMWKKSNAWFYHGVPKFVLPAQRVNSADHDNADSGLMPNWVSRGRRSASPHASADSPEMGIRQRLDSSDNRRRLPAAPDFTEYRASSPQPRWAQIEANKRAGGNGVNGNRPATNSTRVATRRRSSSSGEDDFEPERNRQATQSTASKPQHQWHGGVQRIVTRCRRFTESTSNSEDHTDEEGGGGASERSPSLPSTPRGSVQTPSSSHEAADGAIPTIVDTSDSKSVDSGVVRSERSHSVTRPASLVPSSPSGGSSGQQASSFLQSLQPPTPVFQQISQPLEQPHQISTSHRLSEDSVGAMSNSGDSKLINEKMNKMSLTFSAAGISSSVQAATPDLSSPEDEQSSLGTLEFSLLYDSVNQNLTVLVIRAKGLKSMDSNGFSDPYVKLHLLPGAAKSTKLRTKTIQKSLNPEWNEPLVYYGITEEERQKKTLRLTVLDEDRFGSDFLGETRVPLKRLTPGREKAFNVYLDKQMPEKGEDLSEERGKILLGLSYNLQKQCLIVEIVRCSQLIGMDPNGYSDPYVKIALRPETDKKHKAKTKTRKKTLNPVYNEAFQIPITLTELAQKTLDVTVWDKDVGKHDDFIGSLQLGIQSKGDRLRHWYDCIKNPGSNFQRWHKLSPEQPTS